MLKEFTKCIALSVAGMMGISLYILADTFFISLGMGADGLTALNLAVPVYNFIHGTGLMLGMGAATKYSIAKSRGLKNEQDGAFTGAVFMGAAASAAFVALGLLLSKKLTLAMGADEAVFAMTDTYMRVMFLFSPAFIFNDIIICFVRNDDRPGLSMAAQIIGSLANIVLDYVFIFPLGMGIFGAAVATGISPILSIAVMSGHWLGKERGFDLRPKSVRARLCMGTLSLGFPSLIAQVSSGVVMIVFNSLILGISGNTGVAAYGVVANISLVAVAVYSGIAQGSQPLVSRAFGSGRRKDMHRLFRYTNVFTTSVSAAIFVAVFVFADPIAAVFNSGASSELQGMAVRGLRLYFTSSLFAGFNVILAGYFTSVERGLPAHVLSTARGIALIIPVAVIMAKLWGMDGVWLAYPATELIAAAAGAAVYMLIRRQEQNRAE